MFRYQFGPFLAYFHSGRNDDLLLTDYARGVTEMSEETWLWYGYGCIAKVIIPALSKPGKKPIQHQPKLL
jgi:hypothetical protein